MSMIMNRLAVLHSSCRSFVFVRSYVMLLAVLLLALVGRCQANNRGTTPAFFSPVPYWQESWTASQASSTVIAMVYRDCIVLFFQSPPSSVWKGIQESSYQQRQHKNASTVEVYGLQLEEHYLSSSATSMSSTVSLQYAPSWVSLPTNSQYQRTLCAMTGLAVDVEHLYRLLQKTSEDYRKDQQHHMATTNVFMKRLASILQSKCLVPGRRPYGVQGLFVGCDGIIAEGSEHGGGGGGGDGRLPISSSSLCIYSMDPSGSWQSWTKGTAIGKFAPELRRLLGQKMKLADAAARKSFQHDETDETMSAQIDVWWSNGLEGAVECLVRCWKETCQQHDINLRDTHEEEYNVLIMKRCQHRKQRKKRQEHPEGNKMAAMSSPSSFSTSRPSSAIKRNHHSKLGTSDKVSLFSVPCAKLDEITHRVNEKLRQGR